MAVLRMNMKQETNDNLSTQMALMQLRWQQMRQFEFQALDPKSVDRSRQDHTESIYSVT